MALSICLDMSRKKLQIIQQKNIGKFHGMCELYTLAITPVRSIKTLGD